MNTGHFELPAHERRALFSRQVVWAGAQLLATLLFALWGMDLSNPIALGVATGVGLAAARREDLHLIPFYILSTLAGTLLLGTLDFSAAIAAGASAGLLAGRPGFTGRLEGAFAGMAAAGVAAPGLSVSRGRMCAPGAVSE